MLGYHIKLPTKIINGYHSETIKSITILWQNKENGPQPSHSTQENHQLSQVGPTKDEYILLNGSIFLLCLH